MLFLVRIIVSPPFAPAFLAGLSRGRERYVMPLPLRSVVIDNFDDFHPRHALPVEPAIRLYWQRIMVWLQNEPARVDQINGELSFPVCSQLMAPSPRDLTQVVQVLRRLDLGES